MTRPLAEYLCPPGYHAPSLWSLAAEAHIVREAAQVMLRRSRPGHPDAAERELPVLLIPAFMAGDATLRRLAARLRQNGYRTFGSGMRANIGCAQAAGEALEHRLQTIVHRTEHPAAVVGHSLGGLLAKTLAHRRPDLVAGIVTLGSPLLAPAAIHQLLKWELILCHHLHRWGLDTLISADCTSGDCAQTSWQQLAAPTPSGLPFTCVYSRSDGVVDWRACLHPAANHAQVSCSHLGMAIDTHVHTRVLDALQQISTAPTTTKADTKPVRRTA